MFRQSPVLLVHRIWRQLEVSRSLTKPLRLAPLISYRFSVHHAFLPRAQEDDPCWKMHLTLSQIKLPLCLLVPRYFLFADVTGFMRTNPDFLTAIVLRDPTMGERDFLFPIKLWGKNVSWIIFSTPSNAPLVFVVTRLRNIQTNFIARTTAE